MCRLILMTIALLLILLGVSGFWMMPKLLQRKIEQRMELIYNSPNWHRFTVVPIPLTVKFYLFNVTNSDKVLAGLEKPKFAEVGPFMYKQWRRRDAVDFEDENRRIRYRESKTFYPMFSQHNSEYLNPANFNVTIVNVPLLSLLTKFAQLEEGSIKRNLVSKVATRLIQDSGEKILITKPANQILFDGYRVDFMESARDLVSETLGFNFDSPLPGNKFGFFYNKNGTWNKKEGGEITIFSGRYDSMDNFYQIHNWNGQRQLSVWPNDTIAGNKCNQIKGTDGSQFHPGVTRDQVLQLFSPLVCRSLYIKYKEDTSAFDIPLLRFGTPPELFAAPRKSPSNACFCTIPQPPIGNGSGPRKKGTKSRITDSRCYLDGLMDLSLCQKGAPIAASSPHFYNADPMLALAADAKPRKELHETYIDIEPMTGSVFRAASRAQLNAFVERAALEVVDPAIVGNMTDMVAPLLWLEEAGGIDLKSSNEFKEKLLNLVLKVNRTFKYSIIFGIILAIVVAVQYWYVTCYSFDNERTSSLASGASSRRRRIAASKTERILRGRRMRENILLSTGARKSNLAAKLATEDHFIDEEGHSSVEPTIDIATVLAASTATKAIKSRNNNRKATNNKQVEGDDELSKQMLIGNECGSESSTNDTSSAGSRSSQNVIQAGN